MSAVLDPTSTSGATAPPLPGNWARRVWAVRNYHHGAELARSVGAVADIKVGPAPLVPQAVFVTSAQGARDVLAGHNEDLDKHTALNVQGRVMFKKYGAGEGNLFNLPNQPWVARKRALQPVFTKPRVATYVGHMSTAADLQARRWIESGTVNLDAESRRLTLDVLGRSVLGLDLGYRAEKLAPVVNDVITPMAVRSLRPVRAPYWLPTPARHRFRSAVEYLNELSDEAMARCRENPEHEAPLIRQLLDAVDPETGASLTDDDRRNDLLVFLTAGHDTTATTLAFALWQLGRRPDLQQNVADEVLALGDQPLDVRDVHRLPYTVQVLHEAMRLCPPAAAVARMTMGDVVIDGFAVPRGYNVIVGIYALHRDPDVWDDPTAFDPDRFSPERSAARDRWQFLPFGGGPRKCIGDHFAMLEATIGLATIVRAVRLESLSAEFPMRLGATLVADGPVPVRVTART